MPPVCTPSDDGGKATDRYSDGCKAYESKPYTCGTFDIPGFNSMTMCCACGGGNTISPPVPPPQVEPFAPPGSPPAGPPLQPGHVLLQDGGDLSQVLEGNPTVQVIELEPDKLFNVSAPINVNNQNVTITLSYLATDGSKRATIEVDTDEAFASIGAGGSLSLSGVVIVRSAQSLNRRRRLATNHALVDNNGGSLNIVDSVLKSGNSFAVNSIDGNLNISHSLISGTVNAAKGKMFMRDSSFADASPMVMAFNSTKLLVGTGNLFNFSDSRSMEAIVQTDSTSTATYVCESTGSCQLSTSKAADVQIGVCLAGSAAVAHGECRLCSPGTFTNQTNQTECGDCTGGSYQDEAGQTACTPCTLGHACPEGSPTPVECAAGYYGDQLELSECKPCEGGRYCAPGSFKGLICARGNYCPPLSSNMTQCPAGQYGTDTGLNSSLCSGPCAPGHYCPVESMSPQMQTCPAGSYNGSHGLKSVAECAECPAGTGCPSGSADAIKCAPGTVAPNASMAACVKCVAGKYQADPGQETCTDCPPGSYCAEGATAPSRCRAGYYSKKFGESDNTTACQLCKRGSACPSGAEKPTQCQPGTVQNSTGQKECDKCESGKFQSGRGKFECEICTLGGYCTKGSSAPSPCLAGKFGNMTGLARLHDCFNCEPGNSCPLGAVAPVPCTPGSIAPVERYDAAGTTGYANLAKCEQCVPGKFQNEEGKKVCNSCKQGGYCEAGAAVPALCPAGFYGELEERVNVTQCKACDSGMKCPVGSAGQTRCAAGTYANASAALVADRHVCIKCAAGTYQNDLQKTECKPCETGGYCTLGAAAVRPCGKGSYNDRMGQKNQLGCLLTDPGFYAKTGSSNQTACSPGTVQPNASTDSCVKCVAGTFQDEQNGTTCKPCLPGYHCKDGASVALPCEEGTYTAATNLTSADECTNTTAGHYAVTGSSMQTQCSPGTVQPNPSMGTCVECEAGKFQDKDGKTGCDACLKGFYCPAGASAALPCKAGTYSEATNLDKDSCTPTVPGFYASTGTTKQTKCSPGTVAPNASMGTCVKCAGGKYQHGEGKLDCISCVEGYYCPEGASAALPCREGSYSKAIDLDEDVRKCTLTSPGFYAPTGSTEQTPCSPGTFAPNVSTGTCPNCPAGSFQKESNASRCDPCKAGYYCPEGAAASLPCAAGTHSDATNNPSAVECSLTESGFYAPTGSKRQTACPLGSYDPILKGEPDNATLEQCELCPAGKYAGETNQTECTVCTVGNWCSEGSSAPTPCFQGKVGMREGLLSADECDDCYPGSWCSAGMNIKCPRDTYGELSGQRNQGACKPCPEFSESQPGSSSETMCVCRKGYYSINRDPSEVVRCAKCPSGTNCDTNGTTIFTLQSAILPGYYRYTNRSAEIRRCPDYRNNVSLADGRDRSSCSPAGEPVSDLGCRLGTEGAFCEQCNVTDGSHYFSHTTSTCKVCTGNIGTPAVTGTIIFLFVLLVGGCLIKFKPHERFPWFQMAVTRALDMANSISLRAKIKQVTGFYQIATNIQVVYQINMPSDTQSFLDSLQGVVNFDIVETFGLPLSCANLGGYESKLLFMIVSPIVVCLSLILAGICKQWFDFLRKKVKDQVKAAQALAISQGAAPRLSREKRSLSVKETAHDHSSFWKSTKRGVLTALPAVSIITFLAFPAVSSTAFRVWACVEFETDTKYDSDNSPLPRAEPDIRSFMSEDPSIMCGRPLQPLAAPCSPSQPLAAPRSPSQPLTAPCSPLQTLTHPFTHPYIPSHPLTSPHTPLHLLASLSFPYTP